MKEYELFVPVYYNDGSPVEKHQIDRIGELLLAQFEGLAAWPAPRKANVLRRDWTSTGKAKTS